MKKSTMVLGVSLAFATFLPFSASAQQQPAQTSVERELRSLGNRTGEIVRLLEELVAQRAEDQRLRRLQVAVLALQLRSTGISSIEERIRNLEDRVATAKEQVSQIEAELERLTQRALDDSIKPEGRRRLEASRGQMESQLELANQRAWNYERQILDLQNDLNSKRGNVEALEEIVMEGLSSL